jgi:hypothetical protein
MKLFSLLLASAAAGTTVVTDFCGFVLHDEYQTDDAILEYV